MRMLTAALISVALLSCAGAAPARAASVTISSCYDGDTCRTTSGERIRLACIDTPELRGKYAQPVAATTARNHLRRFLDGKAVTVRRITTDRYGRTVGELYANGTNVQQEMVASGHARIYWKYAHHRFRALHQRSKIGHEGAASDLQIDRGRTGVPLKSGESHADQNRAQSVR